MLLDPERDRGDDLGDRRGEIYPEAPTVAGRQLNVDDGATQIAAACLARNRQPELCRFVEAGQQPREWFLQRLGQRFQGWFWPPCPPGRADEFEKAPVMLAPTSPIPSLSREITSLVSSILRLTSASC